jgi:hypothetical protein
MRQKVKKYKVTTLTFLLCLILVSGGTIWAYVTLHVSSQPLILRFSEYAGITTIGNIWDIMGLGAFGILLVGINFFLAINLQERERFLGKIITGVTLFLAVLIFITLSAIISVN